MKLPPLGSILGVLGALIVGGAAWYVIWSPAFRISEVQVQGVSASTELTIRHALDDYENGRTLFVLPRRNVLFFSEQAAKSAIEKSVYLDSVDIRKKLPNTVIVTIKEKTTKAVFDREGHLYALDASGFVLRELTGDEMGTMGDLPPGMDSVQVAGLGAQTVDVATLQQAAVPSAGSGPAINVNAPAPTNVLPPAVAAPTPASAAPPANGQGSSTSKNAWPLILDHGATDGTAPKPILPGTQAFTAGTLAVILQASSRLPDIAGEPVRWYVPDESSDSIDATMTSGWHVYLAASTPFDVQAERLGIILKQKIGDKKSNLLYVDLRYNERIFYRLKGETQ